MVPFVVGVGTCRFVLIF